MHTFNEQRCDYIEVLNSYLLEASTEETEYDTDAIRVRLNFVSQLTGEQFMLNKEYLLNTHSALLCKGLIGVHVPNLPGLPVVRARTRSTTDLLNELFESGIQVKGYPLFPSDCAPRLSMLGGNRLTGESETRDSRDLNLKPNPAILEFLSDFYSDYPRYNPLPKSGIQMLQDIRDPKRLEGRVFMDSEMSIGTDVLKRIVDGVTNPGEMPVGQTVEISEGAGKTPISPSIIHALKHHPAVVNEQYRSKAFLNVMPAAHAEKLMKNMQCMFNMMNEQDDPEYYQSVKTEIKRLRYIAEGDIKSHRDVDSKWVD